jgi:hypothetical protein
MLLLVAMVVHAVVVFVIALMLLVAGLLLFCRLCVPSMQKGRTLAMQHGDAKSWLTSLPAEREEGGGEKEQEEVKVVVVAAGVDTRLLSLLDNSSTTSWRGWNPSLLSSSALS